MLQKITFIAVLIIAIVSINLIAISKPNDKPHTLLWEIKKNNKTLYLLGSVHIANNGMYPLDTAIINNFNRSDVLGVEIDLSNIASSGTNLFADILDTTENSETLKILPPDLIDKIARKAIKLMNHTTTSAENNEVGSENDLGMEQNIATSGLANIIGGMADESAIQILKMYIGMLKPWGIALILETIKLMDIMNNMTTDSDTSTERATGIDQYLLQLATSKNKKIYEMESVERQIGVFKSIQDSNLIVDYLYAALESDDEVEQNEVKNLLNAWKNGDIKTLESMINKDLSSDAKVNKFLKEQLIYKRNREMAVKIEDLIESDKQYFIIVGAGHVIGNDGIVDILNKTKKYTIKRY